MFSKINFGLKARFTYLINYLKIYFFQYNDLVLSGCAKERRVLCIGGARIDGVRKKSDEGSMLFLIVLFVSITCKQSPDQAVASII